MRSSAFGILGLLTLAGCGMVTGLSSDYKFVADDAAGGGNGDAGSDGAGGDAQVDAASACGAGAFTCTTSCIANCCDEAAACWGNPDCKQFAECRRPCVRNSECLTRCENNATSDARDLYGKVTSCLPSGGGCRALCGFSN